MSLLDTNMASQFSSGNLSVLVSDSGNKVPVLVATQAPLLRLLRAVPAIIFASTSFNDIPKGILK
ncbi:hypothetical protein LGAA44_20005 [Leuconostoc gasicomitatum]|nr:hypothetical protein LGAA44_20005 [Leuconostoc gasicomitatum]